MTRRDYIHVLRRTYVTSKGCWIWRGSKHDKGYARVYFKGKMYSGHRFMYELFRGNVPNGLEMDHSCKVTSCINPYHVEPVTHLENVRRGNANYNIYKTHCSNGHMFTDMNTYIRHNKDGSYRGRMCRTCNRINANAYYHSR